MGYFAWVDLVGWYRGCAPLPLQDEVFAFKIFYLTSQLCHSLMVHLLVRKILDLPLL